VDTPDRIFAEFVRYADGDAFCCPSGRSVASYTVERTNDGSVVSLAFATSQRVGPRP